ncbi:HlyD family secretion protein [Pedobacter sp. PAMC26386]|nr:HlyD family secretion protein [Pedobacter sp. PAMC26386]
MENEKKELGYKAERWISSWGILMSSIILSLFVPIAFLIPYKDGMSFNAQFHTQHKIVPVISPYNGIIKRDVFDINNAIEPNTFLFTIFDLSAQKETSVYAKEAGYYLPYKIKFRNKTYVSKNDTLFYIMPDIKNKGEVYCTAKADEFEISKLSIGDQVQISLERYEQEANVSGIVSSIATNPDQSGKYPFQISLDNKDIKDLSEKGMFNFDQQGKAQVNFKTQKLAYKLLSFL